MKCECSKIELGKLCSRLSSGKSILASKVHDSGLYPVYGGNGLRGFTDEFNFDGECAIIGRQGAFCGNVRYFAGKAYMTEHAIVVCANEDNNTRFLAYCLSTMNLGRLSGQSAQPGLSVKTLAVQEIRIPPLETQKKIAAILSALDEKIAINRAINDNLMQQARLLFKSWFVDYLPFGCIVPTDWQTMTLGEVSNMSAGGDKPKVVTQYRDETCKYPIYSNGLSDDGLYGYTNEPKIFDESVTVSARGTIGFVCLRHIPYVPIVRLVTLVPKANVMDAKYLYLYLNQLHIRGTGTTQQQLTVPDFRKTTILVPTKSVLDHFSDIVTPLFTKKWANDEENSSLADLRNTLLPKLLSGELDVSDIDL